jgi:asparagine synthase (glutamine-hydrolysing)
MKQRDLTLTVDDFSSSFDRVVHHLDEPIYDPACFAMLSLCETARRDVKVLLSGEGSDELFAGYEGRYAGLSASMKRTRHLRWLAPLLPPAKIHASERRFDRFLTRAHSSPGGEAAMLRIAGLPGDVRNPQILSFDQLLRLPERAEEFGKLVFQSQRDNLSEQLTFDLEWYLAESLLQKADKMSMGASIELRTPFLDVEVAALAAQIPSTLKLPEGGPGKFILRKVLEKKGDDSFSRAKKGFPIPLSTWVRGPLHSRIYDELFASNSIVCDYLDRQALLDKWQDFSQSGRGWGIFFALWHYERWRRLLSAAPQQNKIAV